VKRETYSSYRTYRTRPRRYRNSRRGTQKRFGGRNLLVGAIGILVILVGLVVLGSQTFDFLGSRPVPTDNTMKLTIPKMERVKGVPVYTAPADDEEKLGSGTIHLDGTGYPWEAGSNVYIAGHRLGYPNTRSFLVFYDLNKLENGDRVVLRDSAGTRYVYRVFNQFVANPTDVQITEPVPGKSIVSLQTCTLPDYSKRLVVQAEYVTSKVA
jgi:sortase A